MDYVGDRMEHWNIWRVFRLSEISFQVLKPRKKIFRLWDFASKRSNPPYQVFQVEILDKNVICCIKI
jgi:hypothetical protein